MLLSQPRFPHLHWHRSMWRTTLAEGMGREELTRKMKRMHLCEIMDWGAAPPHFLRFHSMTPNTPTFSVSFFFDKQEESKAKTARTTSKVAALSHDCSYDILPPIEGSVKERPIVVPRSVATKRKLSRGSRLEYEGGVWLPHHSFSPPHFYTQWHHNRQESPQQHQGPPLPQQWHQEQG